MRRLKPLVILLLTIGVSLSAQADFLKLEKFGENPGDLEASYFTPNIENPALVVLLHGCAQQGDELALQSGLFGLAKKHNFALLLPQQGLSNNIKRCFNWYSADDFTRDLGETLSIKNMINRFKAKLGSEDVYIIGLSGGGAMASGMLANYPTLFTGGAVVAGIPFPCADGLITGISCMRNGPSQTADELATLVKNINPQQTNWPKLSVWTGENDSIVNPLNSSVFAQQWANLSTLENKPIINKKSGYTITRWQNSAKEARVELIEVSNLGHGIMVNPQVENGGEVSDYLLASPVSTVKHVIDFWQLSLSISHE
ncbi:extracellular catalytic domain type 1 short-chain-length polyhydroxyalkanoate depolymerase [Candidatus Colwellia aromaticivorans]|uniref:extracellular catalytic domain type 1 short-chain-length polyhydroxyalkanoate depolymerase n=1 Tax=Candidatus Colwellia aromaticivorans TaxID=2267621 RepID=UPI000DF3293F|nr:PHB depolymerase family esterase [Candidatus Colwellia aromaticivorans]